MRRLILMRHGEAENSQAGKDDKSRRLTAPGIASAGRCGQEIRARGFSPDLIFCSDAVRTLETMQAVVQKARLLGLIQKIKPELYLAGEEMVARLCEDAGDNFDTILMIGHNPGWSDAVLTLSGNTLSLGTAEAALLEHSDGEWMSAIHAVGTWKLKAVVP